MQPRNLAARAGRWSATHRKTASLGWILFVVLATVIGGNVGQQTLGSSESGNGESKKGSMIVDDAVGVDDGAGQTDGDRPGSRGRAAIARDHATNCSRRAASRWSA